VEAATIYLIGFDVDGYFSFYLFKWVPSQRSLRDIAELAASAASPSELNQTVD
jgi:hypothetical protein